MLSYHKNFVGTQKQVRINHGKQAIGVQVMDVLLYCGEIRKIIPDLISNTPP